MHIKLLPATEDLQSFFVKKEPVMSQQKQLYKKEENISSNYCSLLEWERLRLCYPEKHVQAYPWLVCWLVLCNYGIINNFIWSVLTLLIMVRFYNTQLVRR